MIRPDIVVLSSGGRITIPRRIRNALGLRAGDELVFRVEATRLLLRPVGKSCADWRALEGAFGPSDQTMAQILAEGRAEKLLA